MMNYSASKHDHNNCEHTLKHCPQCDVAYCIKCNDEWIKRQFVGSPYTVNPGTQWEKDFSQHYTSEPTNTVTTYRVSKDGKNIIKQTHKH